MKSIIKISCATKPKNSPPAKIGKFLSKRKNEVKKMLSSAKEEFVKEKLEEHEANPRTFWRTINDISGIGKNKNSRKCTKIIDENKKSL